jgi:hypothetical protein
LEWLREHTRLLLRALEWDKGGRAENRLLSGSDIMAAKAWAARRPQGAPEPTALHLDFVKASEEAETARENATRRALEERARLLTETETAQARTACFQKRAQWALAVIAALVVVGIGAVSWQYRANLVLQASLDESGRELRSNQRQPQHKEANLLGALASFDLARSNIDSALRFSAQGARMDLDLPVGAFTDSPAAAQLAIAVSRADWRLMLRGHRSRSFPPPSARTERAS